MGHSFLSPEDYIQNENQGELGNISSKWLTATCTITVKPQCTRNYFSLLYTPSVVCELLIDWSA